MAKLLCTDSRNPDGGEIIKEFDNEQAQRMLDVKHPQKGWVLKDEAYKMEKGKIVPVVANKSK